MRKPVMKLAACTLLNNQQQSSLQPKCASGESHISSTSLRHGWHRGCTDVGTAVVTTGACLTLMALCHHWDYTE